MRSKGDFRETFFRGISHEKLKEDTQKNYQKMVEWFGGKEDGDLIKLVIPNQEIHWIFVEQINEWFEKEAVKDSQRLESFCRVFYLGF